MLKAGEGWVCVSRLVFLLMWSVVIGEAKHLNKDFSFS